MFGDVVCWGLGLFGRLGYASTTNYYSPSAALAAHQGGVQTTQTGAVATLKLACGGEFTMALLADGIAQGWGRNIRGQLGLGHTQLVGDNEHPWEVPDGGPVTLSGPARDVSCGMFHCCTVMAAPNLGRVTCWGYAWDGRLGYANRNSIGDDEVVSSAGYVDVGGTGNVTAVFCAGYHTLALMNDAALHFGQLGLGHTNDIGDNEHPSTQPNVALGLGGRTIAWVSAGRCHSCGVSVAGEAKCWGAGGYGRLGTGNTNNVTDPSAIGFLDFGVGAFVVQLEAFYEHTCGVLVAGNVKCFGESEYGVLGCGWSCTDRLAPNETVALNGRVSGLSIGCDASHTLALHPDGQFQTWGDNFYGQLGYGDTNDVGDDETPASVGNVNFTNGVSCASPLANLTLASETETQPSVSAMPHSATRTSHSQMGSITATTASETATLPSVSATLRSVTRASHSQTGITRTPRSQPATLGSSAWWSTSTSSTTKSVLGMLSSSSSPRGVVTLVLVGVGAAAVLLLVVLCVVAAALGFVLRRRRSDEVEMSPVSGHHDGVTYANAGSVVAPGPGGDGLTYANVGGVNDAASESANAPPC